MKTKVEMSGYEIEIEMHDDSISIKAEKDGETLEELSLPLTEKGSEDMEDMEDEESDMEDMEEDDFDEELPMGDDGKLESFQSYIKKTNRRVAPKKIVNEALNIDPETLEILAVTLGPLVVGGSAVAIEKVMNALKAGKAGKIGKKIADHLEEAGKAAGDSRRSYQSKGKG